MPDANASTQNGMIGMPGSTPTPNEQNDTTPSAIGYCANCFASALSAAPSMPAFVTSKPAATETTSAGICVTRPSPTERQHVRVDQPRSIGMPCDMMPMMMPPTMLMNTIRMPAMASPRTNLLAPSMAPKNELSSSSALRRARASFSLMRPAERSASIAICLPGMASKVKRAATSAIRVEPRVITTKFTITRMKNTITPMTKLPLITNCAKAAITSPAACSPDWPLARMRRVDAMLSESRSSVEISSTDGNAVNSSGFLIMSAVISTRIELVIGDRQQHVEHQRRQRHQHDRQNAEHDRRERDLAAHQHAAQVVNVSAGARWGWAASTMR